MPRYSPDRIELSDEERTVLETPARSYTFPYGRLLGLRCSWPLRGLNGQMADRMCCGRDLLSQWRKRFLRAAPRRTRRSDLAREIVARRAP